MMRIYFKLWLLFLLLTSPASRAEVIFDVVYRLDWGMMHIGDVHRKLERKNDLYYFTSDSKPQGFASFITQGVYEESVFKITNGKIQSVSYLINKRDKKKQTYRYAKDTVVASGHTNLTIKNIEPDSMDYLNTIYAVMLGLAKGKRFYEFSIRNKPEETTIFKLRENGAQKITVEAGQFETLVIKKEKIDDVEFTMWMAPKLSYLPVRIENTNKQGRNFVMELIDFRGN